MTLSEKYLAACDVKDTRWKTGDELDQAVAKVLEAVEEQIEKRRLRNKLNWRKHHAKGPIRER